jgi:hypothetical protein
MRSTILLFLALAVSAFGQAFPGSAAYQAAFFKPAAAVGGGGSDLVSPYAYWANTNISGADGTQMTSWKDSGIGTFHATGLLGAVPYITNNVENSRPAVRFTTQTLHLTPSNAISLTAPYTIAGIMRIDTSGGSKRGLSSSSQNRVLSFERGGAANVFLGAEASNYSPPASTAHVFFLAVTGSGNEYYIDGTNRTTSAAVTGTWPDLRLGPSNSEDGDHYLFEIGVWTNVAFTSAQMNAQAHVLTNVTGRWTDIP